MLVNIADYLEKKKEQVIVNGREMLYKDGDKVENPEYNKSFAWLLDRIDSGECELICPDSFADYPFDKNKHLSDWMKRIDDDRYLCAIFVNPQVKCDALYSRSLKPSETDGLEEAAYMVEPFEAYYVLKEIDDAYGLSRISILTKNAAMLSC